MLTEHFLIRGYEVFSAANLHEARAIFYNESPKVVILDLHLKGESGADLLKEIKPNRPMTKVIIFTANDDPALPQKLLAQGADSFWIKRGSIKIIGTKVEEYCVA